MKTSVFIGAILLTCVIFPSSCELSGYRRFQQLKGFDHYSFERPASYSLTMNQANTWAGAENGVRFVAKLSDGSEIVLMVKIGLSPEAPDAKAAADRLLSVAGRELIERSTGNVSGVSCELVTLYTENLPEYNITSKFEEDAYFNYNNRLWNLTVYSERNEGGQVSVVFEYLFSTFKLLP